MHCSYDDAPKVIASWGLPIGGKLDHEIPESRQAEDNLSWKVNTFSYEGVIFCISPQKVNKVFTFSIVMLASRAECAKYKIEMTLHESDSTSDDSEVSFRFCGKPCSIDLDKEEVKHLGLTVDSRGMEQILKKGNSFSLSFSIKKITPKKR